MCIRDRTPTPVSALGISLCRLSDTLAGLHKLWQPCSQAARKWRENEEMKRKWRENEEMKRKWRENEEMEREIHSQDFLILCLFPPSLSISYIKNCHILSQNVKYGTYVANVTKNLTYALGENNSGSNSLRESSASCEGLSGYFVWHPDIFPNYPEIHQPIMNMAQKLSGFAKTFRSALLTRWRGFSDSAHDTSDNQCSVSQQQFVHYQTEFSWKGLGGTF